MENDEDGLTDRDEFLQKMEKAEHLKKEFNRRLNKYDQNRQEKAKICAPKSQV